MVLAGCARAAGEQALEGVKTCRLVLRTSKGDVTKDAAVPDKAPEMKVMVIPGWMICDSVKYRLRDSKPAQ